MDLNSILDELNRGTQEELQRKEKEDEDEDFKKFIKGAMALKGTPPPKSSGREPEEPNKNGDFFKHAGALGEAYAQGMISQGSVLQQLTHDANAHHGAVVRDPRNPYGSVMDLPVRPQTWSLHKPSFEREHNIEQEAEYLRDVVFGPFPNGKGEDTVEQLKHLLTQAQANRAQADERPCKKPCRFLKESVRDSEVSGVPVGVRQRCAHPVFEQKAMYGLLSIYAQILNVTEKFCEALVKSNPEVLDALPTARKLQLAASQSLLITPRENNRELIIKYLTDMDFLRTRVAGAIDDMKKNHALTVSDDRYFTNDEEAKQL